MKTKIVVKLCLVLTFGSLFGVFTQHSHENWRRLGKEAYLTSQSQWFDRRMANLTTTSGQIVEFAFAACLMAGAYECAAYVVTALLTPKAQPKNL